MSPSWRTVSKALRDIGKAIGGTDAAPNGGAAANKNTSGREESPMG